MNLNDMKKAITAEDLIRRYKLDELSADRKKVKSMSNTLSRQNNLIKQFIMNITPYKNQAKNYITAWFFSGIPTLENEPFINFGEDILDLKICDLYYDLETGIIYQLKKDDVFCWEVISDSNLQQSLALASSEADTYDNKRNIYFDTPTTPYEAGDIWYQSDAIMRCRCSRTEGNINISDWCIQEDYSEQCVVLETSAVLNEFKKSVERNYITNVQLEITKDEILEVTEAKTTEVEILANNNYLDLKAELDGKASVENVTEVVQKVEEVQNATEQTITIIEDIQTNGVNKVHTETGYTFDKDGLHIDKTGSPVGSELDEAGLEIEDKTGSTNETQFYGGYVTEELAEKTPELEKFVNQTATYSKNILFKQFLMSLNWRQEEVEDEDHGVGYGFFYVGDDSE